MGTYRAGNADGRRGINAPQRRKILLRLNEPLMRSVTDTQIIFLKPYQRALKANLEELTQAFHAQQPIDEIVHKRAMAVDEVLIKLWQKEFPGDGNRDISLIAVGGYGRGELHPKSDVDIMILLAEKALTRHQAAIERFIAGLWDLGLEIGHSVRTCSECALEATKDVTVVTNLLESRLLAGPAELLTKMREATAE